MFEYSKKGIVKYNCNEINDNNNDENDNQHSAFNKYSSMICIGTEPNLVCNLKDICYKLQFEEFDDKESFLYFLDPLIEDISFNYLLSKIQISHHQNRFMQLKIIKNKTLPILDVNNDKILKLYDTSIIHKVYRSGNLGHNLLDDWYPIWFTLSLFNKYNYFKNNLIFYGKLFWTNKHIKKIYPRLFSEKTKSQQNYFIFPFYEEDYYLIKDSKFKNQNKWLWDHNGDNLENLELSPNVINLKTNKKLLSTDYEYICFKDLLIGSHIFNQHWPHKQFNYNNFINQIFINPHHPDIEYATFISNLIDNFNQNLSKTQRILLLYKSDNCPRRCFYSYSQLLRIKNIVYNKFNVKMDIINSTIFGIEPFVSNLNEQIKFAMKYTIMISTPGALSFLSNFMNKGTVSIILDFLDINNNKSIDIDPIYDLQLFKKRYRYKVEYDEIVYNKSIANKMQGQKRKFDYVRDNVYFNINIDKMIALIKKGLCWVESYNDWNDTFRRDRY